MIPTTRRHLPVLLSLVGLGLVPTSDAYAQAFACGATITTNAVLTADVVCAGAPPGGSALVVGANNLTIDFNGFEVRLDGASGNGIRVNGRSGTTLQNVRVVSASARTGVGIALTNTSGTTITNADLDNGGNGLATGISATISAGSTNTGLSIANANVGRSNVGMSLAGLDSTSSITGSAFAGTTFGLRLLTGTSGFALDAADGNSFTGAAETGASAEAIRIQGTTNVTVDGLDLSGTTGIGIRVDSGTVGTTVSNNLLSGRRIGVYSTGTVENTDLVVTGNDVSNASVYGMYLDSVNTSLVLTGNVFDGSGAGASYGGTAALRVQDLRGPWALDSSNSFVGVATSAAASAIILTNTHDVTVSGFDLSGATGTGVYLAGTTNTVLANNNLSGRRNGIDTTTIVNPGLSITGNDVSGSTVYGMQLDGVDSSLVLTGNDFTTAVNGLIIADLAGPWSLDPTNVFTGVAPGSTNIGVRFQQSSDVTVDGVDLSSTGGAGYGLRLGGVTDFVVQNANLSGRNRGIFADGNNANVTIRDNDVSGASGWGMYLTAVDTLDLHNNDFTGDRNGLRLDDITNTPTVDLAGSPFDDVGATTSTYAVYVLNTTGMTVSKLNARMVAGTAVRVDNGDAVNVANLQSCFANIGVDFNTVTNSSVDFSQIGAGPAGTTYGVDVAGGGYNTFQNSDTAVDVPLRDVGVVPATTTLNLGTMNDSDADGIPDLCDDCPTDPLNGSPCAVIGCAGGDGVTDSDADGWCAGPDFGDDCDDAAASTYPGAPEVCDGIDNNCDIAGEIDEGALFADADADTCNDCAVGAADPANDGTDTDADGLCDAGDPDDDNDTVADGPDVADLDRFRCRDTDLDDCDDCSVAALPQANNDGSDTDADGFCNTSDFTLQPTVLVTKPSWNTFATGGAGAPTVVWDNTPAIDQFVMVYETQTAATGTGGCASGVWTLGVATSTDGVTWTQAASALLANAGYYGCVAAHPTAVKRTGAGQPIVVYFKAEDTTGYRGMGRLVMTWNAGLNRYTVSSVDPNPALSVVANMGYPKAVFDSALGQYRIAYTQRPNMYTTRGTGTSLNAGTLSLSRNFAPWAVDEIINPAVACQANGSYHLYVGGRDTGPGAVVLNASMGRRQSVRGNFTSWSAGPGALVDLLRGDPQLRHWDVLRNGTQHVMFFSELSGGTPQIRSGYTGTSAPTPSTTNDKVCQ